MSNNKLLTISLILVFLLSLFLRSYNISTIVPILNRDEAALGYNARLLKETGKDEWGQTWPIAPKSFGDSKLIGYPLLLVGLFQFLRYADWVVRLPAIVAGSLLPIVVFFFCRTFGISKRYAFFAALSIAVNPVFVHFSRFAYEAVVAVTYFVTAIALVFYTTKQSTRRITLDLIAATLFLASMLTYNTPLLLLPLILFIIPFYRGLLPIKKWLITVVILSATWFCAFLLLFPMLGQKSGIAIFSDQTYVQSYPNYRESFFGIAQLLLGNRYVYYAKAIIIHIWQSFSPQFLVLGGGAHPWHSLIGYGHITWIVYFGAMIGMLTSLYAWIKTKKQKLVSNTTIMLVLLLISLVPASITVDAPHATRSLLFFIVLVVLATQFFQNLSTNFRLPFLGRHVRRLLFVGLVIATSIGGMTFFATYLKLYPTQAKNVYQTGFPALIATLDQQYPNKSVAIVDPGGYQYILLAWYGKYAPTDFDQTILKQQPNTIGLQYGERLGRYHFIVQASDRVDSESIIVTWEEQSKEWRYQLL